MESNTYYVISPDRSTQKKCPCYFVYKTQNCINTNKLEIKTQKHRSCRKNLHKSSLLRCQQCLPYLYPNVHIYFDEQ